MRTRVDELINEIIDKDARIAELEGTIGLERIEAHKLQAENARLRKAHQKLKVLLGGGE